MASLTAIFGSNQEDTGDSEKLLELYWNRAELKKEFAGLREETFQLKEQIAEREGATARLQQKLDHLENLLLDSDWVYNVLVYYQLRAFNNRCKARLARFAEQLKQQQEERAHGRVIEAWNEQREDEAQNVQSQIGEQRMRMQLLEDQLQAERHRYSSMGAFMRFFRKRSITTSLDGIAADIEQEQARESASLAALEEIQSRAAPGTDGLNIPSKRSINFMILSFAQQMYLQYSSDNLSSLAKESGDKSVGAVNYGNKENCDLILKILKKHTSSMDNIVESVDVLQKRAKLIADKALFQEDDHAVPVPDTVATVFAINDNGVIRESDVNLLGENYWEVANVVSR